MLRSYSPEIRWGVSGYDRYTFKEFIDEYHRVVQSAKPYMKETDYAYLENLTPDSPETFIEMPIPSYEEYKEMYSERVAEYEDDKRFENERRERTNKRREKTMDRIRSKRTPEYYQQEGPKSLRFEEE